MEKILNEKLRHLKLLKKIILKRIKNSGFIKIDEPCLNLIDEEIKCIKFLKDLERKKFIKFTKWKKELKSSKSLKREEVIKDD